MGYNLLTQELADLKGLDFDLELTGFDDRQIVDFLSDPGDDERANAVPPLRGMNVPPVVVRMPDGTRSA